MHRQGWAARDQVDALLAEASTRPDDFDLRLRIDHAFASKGQFADVVKMWDAFITAHPEDPRAYYERGGAKWHLRQRDDSLTDTQKACDLGHAKACTDLPVMKAMPR